MRNFKSPLLALFLAAGLAGLGDGSATAQERTAPRGPDDIAEDGDTGLAEQYCTNIRDAAADARLTLQSETLLALEKQIEERIAELEAKQAEYEGWLQRREEFISKAGENLVAVYARMRPDAAAEQLGIVDAETAASVLANLAPRTASAILSEMESGRAAQLARAMSGPTDEPQGSPAQ